MSRVSNPGDTKIALRKVIPRTHFGAIFFFFFFFFHIGFSTVPQLSGIAVDSLTHGVLRSFARDIIVIGSGT